MPKKIHLKRNSTGRLALCGIWPEGDFVLTAALPDQSNGTVCKTCIGLAASLTHEDNSERRATRVCLELVGQIRECGMAEQDFQQAQELLKEAIKVSEARIARVALRLAMKKREACRLALKFHERDHGCSFAVSASA